MKKYFVITAILIFSIVLNTQAQNEKKIHVKIVKDENGKVTERDTIFIGDDLVNLKWLKSEDFQKLNADSLFEVIKAKTGKDFNFITMDEFESTKGDSLKHVWITVDSDTDGDSIKLDKHIFISKDGNMKHIKSKNGMVLMFTDSLGHAKSYSSNSGCQKVIFMKGDGDHSKTFTIDSDDSTEVSMKWIGKDFSVYESDDANIEMFTNTDTTGAMFFVSNVSIDDDKSNGKNKTVKVIVSSDGDNTTSEVFSWNEGDSDSEKNVKVIQYKTEDGNMVLKEDISDWKLSKDDEKILQELGIENKNNLEFKNMNISFDTNNGKLKLDFTLADKGNVKVKVLDQSGKTVFEEKVKRFDGSYSKEIDLSKAKSVKFFIQIIQGDKSIVEKLVVKKIGV